MYRQGDIVLIPIPFTDLSSSKKRPVLILSSDNYNNNTDDLIVAAITSNIDGKPYSVTITGNDLANGNLLHESCIRADKLYTLAQSIVIKKFGTVKDEILIDVIEKVYDVITMKKFPIHLVCVDGIVENDKNEILLVKTRHRGLWEIPGGQVESGENLIDAVAREIKEESGIDVAVNKLICVSSNTCSYPGHSGYGMIPPKVMFGFACTYLSGELCCSDETSDARWVPKKDIFNYINAPNLVERFKAYLNFKGDIQYLEYVTKPQYDLKLTRLI